MPTSSASYRKSTSCTGSSHSWGIIMLRRLVTSAITAALCGTALAGTATSASAAPAAVDCRKVKCVALTFDDGPVADTQRLLRILNDRNVKATFYVVGTNVQKNPSTVRA